MQVIVVVWSYYQKEIEAMRKAGLIKGGNANNALVFDEEKLVNNISMKFENEPVRHKILDAIGDLSLCGS